MADNFDTFERGDYVYLRVIPNHPNATPRIYNALFVRRNSKTGELHIPALGETVQRNGDHWKFKESGHTIELIRHIPREQLDVRELWQAAGEDVEMLQAELDDLEASLRELKKQRQLVQGEIQRRRDDREGHMLKLSEPY